MWTWHIHVFSNIKPDWPCFFGCELDHILEPQHILAVFQWESFDHVTKLHIFYASVLIWQDEYISVGVLPLVLVLDKVLDNYRLLWRGGC